MSAGHHPAQLVILPSYIPVQPFHAASVPAADGLGGISSGPPDIFDRCACPSVPSLYWKSARHADCMSMCACATCRDLKRTHRERAAWLRKGEDPLQVQACLLHELRGMFCCHSMCMARHEASSRNCLPGVRKSDATLPNFN